MPSLIFLFSFSDPDPEVSYFQVPGDLIDASIAASGEIFLLLRGQPHMVVLSPDGSQREYDLPEILIPGGMCLDEGWGWYVTGELTDTVCRYDRNGQLLGSWQVAERPGDIAISGLTVMYVSRYDGTVRSLTDPDAEIASLQGSGEGQLSRYGTGVVYSMPGESMVLGRYSTPEYLPDTGIWTGAGDILAVMMDSCVCTRLGEELFRFPAANGFSRISFSQGGFRCLLWSPGGGRVLVVQ